MAETWFDTSNGAVFSTLPTEGMPAEIPDTAVRLYELLLMDERSFPFFVGDFEPVYGRRKPLSADQKLDLGRWAVEVLAESGRPVPLHPDPHLERLHILGITPDSRAFRYHFADVRLFRSLVGSPEEKYGHNGIYSNWSWEEYTQHAERLAMKLGRKPEEADYDRANGPNSRMINRRGGVRKLNECIGYFNTHEMTNDDLIDWGVSFVEVNGPDLFIPLALNILAGRGRGPGRRTVIIRSGSWSTYKSEVMERHVFKAAEHRRHHEDKMHHYRHLISRGELPESYGVLPEDTLLEVAGRYAVIMECLPTLSQTDKQRLADSSSASLIGGLRLYDSNLDAGEIEMIAVALDVFDDIWPSDQHYQHLQISAADIEAERQKHRVYNRRANAKRRARAKENSPSLPARGSDRD